MAEKSAEFTRGLLEAAPSLRAFAISLSGHSEKADDLVQETLMRAWANAANFETGTNLKAWLFTILRNQFTSQYRVKRREVEDPDEFLASTLTSLPEQEDRMAMNEMRAALRKLPSDQREAILLIGASGFSYEEAAKISGCAVGTVKSRVNRARVRLAKLLHLDAEKPPAQ